MLKGIGKVCILVGFLFLGYLDLTGQNQNTADSLKSIYEAGIYSDSALRPLLWQISFNETNPDQKISFTDLLIAEASKDSSDNWLFRGYFQKGNAYRLKADYDLAFETYFKSLDNAVKLDNQEGIGAVYSALADTYSLIGNSRNAVAYYNQGIDVLRRTNDSIPLATALLNAGDEYFNSDKLDSALLYFNESGVIFYKVNYRIGQAYNLGNMGLVYAKQGKHELAEFNIGEASRVLDELGEHYSITEYQSYMVDIYVERGEYDKALEYAQIAYQIAVKEGFKELIQNTSLKLSELYEATGQFDEAYGYLINYISYRDSINAKGVIQQMADLQTKFEVSQKQLEVDLLNQEKRNQQIIGIALSLILVLSGVILIVLYRNNRHKIKTNKQLEALNHTKDRFFSIISHDLRGPVSAFHGISSIIKMHIRKKQYERLVEMTEDIDNSVDQLGGLLDNLLSWAVQQQGQFPYHPEKVSLIKLVNEVVDVFAARALVKRIELKTELVEDLALWVDTNSTMTIFRNLVSNAIKFTYEGGQVIISTRQEDLKALIEIKDSGVGIPDDKTRTLFELKDKKSTYGTTGEKGVGLGLQLVKEFATMNMGSIGVESIEGEGTTFSVLLPLAVDEKLA
ncbi:MAG: tetratricopeptide repeat-containing sensor histidine kinase [Bacteroidetes bacterium]|nr:tetratricopeptide repeat-containing sensor histidine kinase [Bacteroidota bacterium]MDA1120960.1 tetratricopeptide repeat-containing sensor histidine kinase [Bacteroidota bacterium]